MRRLKVEYDVYFGGGLVDGKTKRPPVDLEGRVHTLIKKYSDTQKLSFQQRFRYNSVVQRYAVMSELWRQKLKIREEGYRRPQDALLSIQGLRTDQEHAAAAELNPRKKQSRGLPAQLPYVVECSNPEAERGKLEALFEALLSAKRTAGEQSPPGKFDSFLAFVTRKTEQMRQDFHCARVEYRVEMQNGKAVLKAKAKS